MSITTISIDAVNYIAYASVAEADAYLNIDPTREASWEALSTDVKGKYLVAATRRLDLLSWQGTKTGGEGTQEEAWPRTGVEYSDGTAVSTTEVPIELENATILLAGAISLDTSNSNFGTSGTNVKEAKAGSASVEFFRPSDGNPLQEETAYQLIKQFLEAASISSDLGALASGTDGTSTFDDIDNWGLSDGFP